MGGTGDTMSIDDATPEEWNKVTKELRKDKPKHINGDEIMDEVNNPVHYNKGGIECIQGIQAVSPKEEFEGYLRGNIIKYVWRYRYKDNLKDLEKAKWYLNMLISEIKSK